MSGVPSEEMSDSERQDPWLAIALCSAAVVDRLMDDLPVDARPFLMGVHNLLTDLTAICSAKGITPRSPDELCCCGEDEDGRAVCVAHGALSLSDR